MRDLLFMAAFLPMPVICLIYPWAGILIWSWFAFTYPMAGLWGFAASLPGNMIIALATLTGLLLARNEPKLPPLHTTNLLFMTLALITAVSIIFTQSPLYTSLKTSEYTSIFLYLMLLSIFLRTPARIHAFVWMAAFSIGYFAVRCSAFFIVSGGTFRATGPAYTQLGDNNHLAVACLIVIPLLNYLRLHSKQGWVRLCVLGTMVLTSLTIISTFSRGGFIGLICMLAYLWWKSGRKISHAVLMAAGLWLIVYTASDAWVARMQTIESAAEEDQSFQGRLWAWEVYWNAGLSHPLTGAGPKALEDPNVISRYLPVPVPADEVKPLAAHSIYFQLIGEEGFLALGIYLAILYTAWANGNWIARRARGHPDMAWAVDLGRMGQTSIVAFAITASALSLAFFDLLFSIAIMLAGLRQVVAIEVAKKSGTNEPPATSPFLTQEGMPRST